MSNLSINLANCGFCGFFFWLIFHNHGLMVYLITKICLCTPKTFWKQSFYAIVRDTWVIYSLFICRLCLGLGTNLYSSPSFHKLKQYVTIWWHTYPSKRYDFGTTSSTKKSWLQLSLLEIIEMIFIQNYFSRASEWYIQSTNDVCSHEQIPE